MVLGPGASGPMSDPAGLGLETMRWCPADPGHRADSVAGMGVVERMYSRGHRVRGFSGPTTAGLLVGRHMVTHHHAPRAVEGTGAIVERARLAEDGRLVTGDGFTSGLDVSPHLVERLPGPAVALKLEDTFGHERRGINLARLRRPPSSAASAGHGCRPERRELDPTEPPGRVPTPGPRSAPKRVLVDHVGTRGRTSRAGSRCRARRAPRRGRRK